MVIDYRLQCLKLAIDDLTQRPNYQAIGTLHVPAVADVDTVIERATKYADFCLSGPKRTPAKKASAARTKTTKTRR